ncbi:FKBP-type peptidyl-prolyl cis-trans isomerase [Sphingomonas sp. AOB5]|uniref:FKBP-type peptidyl-prolyl cis-trans isomerase n=1 Tax=Sphingomonas sp. AOB5 TaxID=3034017 RepID=UPI0023F7D5F2|nr:FKBP-type peptidyl-prolyl cis-trans isomerase [Sphingomonas sp. AOB5]MDF7775421.1 FKBP-type peptidyl-prolyl cis-trans isomerase [Sphingomonas sp. AOB5]
MSSVTAVPLQPVKKSVRIWIWLGVVIAIAAAFGLAWMGTREQVMTKMTNEEFLAWNKTKPNVKTTASGLQYEILKDGEGPTAQEGGAVFLNYEGTFRDGKLFDKSQQPTPFPVQDGASIPGFYEALKLMKKGGEYRLWIPANLAYGERTPDPTRLPPNSMLIFKVSVDRLMTPAEVQAMMQMQQQMQGPPPGAEGAPPQGGAPGQ